MKTKNSRNSNLSGNLDTGIVYTGEALDMGGFSLGEIGMEGHNDMLPNISDALADVISMSYGKVGDVVIRSDLNSPEGFPQTDILKVEITGDDKAPNAVKLLFFGVILEIEESETIVSIKQKMLDILNDYVEDNIFLSNAELNDSNDIELTYKDTRKHDTLSMIPYPHFLGLGIETINENIMGFGKWEMIGSKTEKLDGNDEQVTLNYYKRIG